MIVDSSDRRTKEVSIGRRNSDKTRTVKEPALVIYRRYVISRVYVIISILTTLLIFLTSDAYSIEILKTDFGIFVNWFLFMTCIFAIADICVNDILPENYSLLWLYNKRHIIYMILALGMYGISAAIILSNGSAVIMIRMWLDGFFATVVAVLDIFARHRSSVWQSGK